MVGKGQSRREKNYRAAHGGNSRLPPPPDHSKLDALPSKLRQLMSFTSAHLQAQAGSSKGPRDSDVKRKTRDSADVNDKRSSAIGETLQKHGSKDLNANKPHGDSQNTEEGDKRKKRKRKRAQVEDLRFQKVEELGTKSRRKERKKERKKEREAKKKKQKQGNTEDKLDFPRQEKVKFGDVVEAPPKLVVPKALKTLASQERVRLQAVEAYRNRKGWASRPGSHRFPTVDPLLQS